MSVDEIIQRRDIGEVVHFTTNRGLTGILYSKALKSRHRLERDELLEFIFSPNAQDRKKDGDWADYVNLSISRINSQFFRVSDRWHSLDDIWWCVLSFDPEILSNEGVYFTTTNNIYTGVARGMGPEGLDALFADQIVRWRNNVARRSPDLPSNCSTCEQAEVLHPAEVAVEHLKKIYVVSDEIADEVHGLLGVLAYDNIEVVVQPDAFKTV